MAKWQPDCEIISDESRTSFVFVLIFSKSPCFNFFRFLLPFFPLLLLSNFLLLFLSLFAEQLGFLSSFQLLVSCKRRPLMMPGNQNMFIVLRLRFNCRTRKRRVLWTCLEARSSLLFTSEEGRKRVKGHRRWARSFSSRISWFLFVVESAEFLIPFFLLLDFLFRFSA